MGSVVKDTCSSYRGPRFDSQHPMAVHNIFKLHFQGVQCPILTSVGPAGTGYTDTRAGKIPIYIKSSNKDNFEKVRRQEDNTIKLWLTYRCIFRHTCLHSCGHVHTQNNLLFSLFQRTIETLKSSLIQSVFPPGNAISIQILKCMIPETLISEDSVVKAVSWLCVGKCSGNTKVIFFFFFFQGNLLDTLMINPLQPT